MYCVHENLIWTKKSCRIHPTRWEIAQFVQCFWSVKESVLMQRRRRFELWSLGLVWRRWWWPRWWLDGYEGEILIGVTGNENAFGGCVISINAQVLSLTHFFCFTPKWFYQKKGSLSGAGEKIRLSGRSRKFNWSWRGPVPHFINFFQRTNER